MAKCTMTIQPSLKHMTDNLKTKVFRCWSGKKEPLSDDIYKVYCGILETMDKYPFIIFDLLEIVEGLSNKTYFRFISRIHKEKEDMVFIVMIYDSSENKFISTKLFKGCLEPRTDNYFSSWLISKMILKEGDCYKSEDSECSESLEQVLNRLNKE